MQCQNVDKFSSYARLKSHFKNPCNSVSSGLETLEKSKSAWLTACCFHHFSHVWYLDEKPQSYNRHAVNYSCIDMGKFHMCCQGCARIWI